MTDLPIPSTSPAPAARSAAANATLRGVPAYDGATQANGGSFQDVLAQEFGLGTDLPMASVFAAPAPTARSAAASTARRGAPVRDDTTQASTRPFQDALAREFGLGPDGQVLPGPDAPATAVKADISLKSGDDPVQAAAPADAAPGLAFVSAPVVPPALPAASVAPPLLRGAPLPDAERAVSALEPRKDQFTKPSAAAKSEGQPKTDLQLIAADFAGPGKLLPAAAGEMRREIIFNPSLLEQQQAAPTVSTAIHAATAPAQFTQAPTAALNTPVGERGWDQGLGDQLAWMAGQKHQVAELHLNPPDLGPLKITLTLDNDQASAQFVSAHAVVREAIETAMPRLREMLADSGITLGNASVSADAGHSEAQPQYAPRAYLAPGAWAAADPGTVARGARLLRPSQGLVDTFA